MHAYANDVSSSKHLAASQQKEHPGDIVARENRPRRASKESAARRSTLVDVADSGCGVRERSRVSGVGERSRVCGIGDRGCVRGVGERGWVSAVGDRGGRVDDGCGMRRVRDGCSGDRPGCQIAGGRCCSDAGDEKGEKSGALVHGDEVSAEVAETRSLILLRGLSEF
ncbi:Uncharacterized protein DBV15_02547 [Temnothorax longispinosus]|uniref:Uncharacterized protein n=1 Tax=Temnothorax longispinosus TaxID=300112 RepID=A0A4V3SBF3_9HYME|nr:Uncharacterized protein DBV15_02547 [Temnothorax longispinosus]